MGKRAGGQVTRLLRHFGDDLDVTMRTLQQAAGKSDPAAWLGAVLRKPPEPELDEFGLPIQPTTDWNNHPAYRGLL